MPYSHHNYSYRTLNICKARFSSYLTQRELKVQAYSILLSKPVLKDRDWFSYFVGVNEALLCTFLNGLQYNTGKCCGTEYGMVFGPSTLSRVQFIISSKFMLNSSELREWPTRRRYSWLQTSCWLQIEKGYQINVKIVFMVNQRPRNNPKT